MRVCLASPRHYFQDAARHAGTGEGGRESLRVDSINNVGTITIAECGAKRAGEYHVARANIEVGIRERRARQDVQRHAVGNKLRKWGGMNVARNKHNSVIVLADSGRGGSSSRSKV